MSDTIIADSDTLDWGIAVRDAYLIEYERVKHLPEFTEWADTVISEDTHTERGWIPGWNLEDCARKWVEHNGVDLPECPIPRPAWAQSRDVAWDRNEIFVTDSATVSVDDVVLNAQHMTVLVIKTGDWPDGTHTDFVGELRVDEGVYVSSDEELEISAATPEKLRSMGSALTLLADKI